MVRRARQELCGWQGDQRFGSPDRIPTHRIFGRVGGSVLGIGDRRFAAWQELGANGFLHPPTTWGNGVTTTPDLYTALLTTVASHGFVVIASNSTSVTAQDLQTGLDWLIMQNDTAGDFQGKLAVKCAAAIGDSMGGGAAVGAAVHATGCSPALHKSPT